MAILHPKELGEKKCTHCHRAFESNTEFAEPWKVAKTIEDGLRNLQQSVIF